MPSNQIQFGLKSAYLLVSFLLILSSCSDQQVKQEPIKPNEFVNAFTSGQISSQSSVRIVLNLPDEYAGIANNDLPINVIKLTPAVKGKTYWANQSTLIFEPEKPLNNGQNYQAEVDLGKLLGFQDEETQLFKFYFEVIPLTFVFEIDKLQPYNEQSTDKNYLQGRLIASDVFDDKNIHDFLSASQAGKKLEISYSYEFSRKTFAVLIDSIMRLTDKSTVDVVWEGKQEAYGFNEDRKLEYIVPALNHFEFMRARVIDDQDQYVKLEFSDPIDQGQDLNGLVYFTDNTPFRMVIEGNTILLYPSTHQAGNKSVAIKKEVRTRKNVHLQNDLVQSIYFGQVKPQVRFTSDGTIMPGKKGWILPFEAVNLKAVDIIVTKIYTDNIQQFLQVNRLAGSSQLSRVGKLVHHERIDLKLSQEATSGVWIPFAIDLSRMIKQEPGAIYRVDLRFRKSYSTYECDNLRNPTVIENDIPEDNYYTNNYYYPSGYRWNERENPCSNSYYYYNRFKSKNVMATDIGLTVKEDGDRFLVYANNLSTTNPMEGVKVSIFNYQQLELTSATTNAKGVASMDFKGVPYLLIAEKNGQFAYQKLNGGSSLSYSKFETGGVNVGKGMKGFIYGDRGVWRPGDTLFLNLILDDRDNPLPKTHPVTMKLFNPKNKEIIRKSSLSGLNGFYSFKIATGDEALTGFWRVSVEVGGAVFSKKIRIETIKPNRLKIDLNFNKKLLTSGKNKATMSVRWLHGGIASNLKADINITIRPIKTKFENFESYNFDDPSRIFPAEDLILFEGELDKQGNAVIDFDLPEIRFAPGMLKVTFASRVYEQGGDFSIDQRSANFAQFDSFIGIRGPETGSSYLEVDTEHEFEIATVKNTGEAISVNDLEYEVYKLDWSWWYGSNNRNLASYISSHYDRKEYSGKINTNNGKGKFSIKIDYPDWGWYYVRVKNPEGGHQTGMKIYLDWPSSYSRENRKAPGSISLLSLSTEKEKYNVGEEVKVSVPTPANSRLLIALEKGNKQIKSWQINAGSDETVITFEATPEMSPNIYLSVSVFQPHAQTVNDLPIRMYGVVPVMVEDANTVLKPKLDMPESVRPGEKYIIRVSEKNNKNMTYTVAVVDEGLLDLTRFKTPSPHKYFYAKEALAVRTWDIYEDVMGAFGGRLEKVFAIGGDMEMEAGNDKKKANRFKPVVAFLGPFELKAGETNSHQLKMPNYIGSVRCMIVAGENGAYGKTDKTMAVKQPLMVLGTMPRVLAPGEILKLPVSIFVMDEKIKNVEVSIEANALFKLDNKSQNISTSGVGEYMAYFDLEVAAKQGVGKVNINVTSGQEKASYEVEIQVRNPNPRMFDVTHNMLKAGEKWNENVDLVGIEGTNEVNLSISGLPPLNLEKRLKYLIRYPYGCIEQTTSSVFPQLYLNKLIDLNSTAKNRVEQNIKDGIKRISRFQKSDGGFSYWPGSGSSSDWGSSYAGHFLLLAKENGYYVSSMIINSWLRYQKSVSNNWNYRDGRTLEQAYRLYTLALAGEPNMSAMNRLREIEMLDASAKYRLAAAYALVGQKEVAKKLVSKMTYVQPRDRSYWRYNYGSVTRDQAMIIETYILLDDMDKAIPIFNQVSESLKSQRWMSTQTTAFALYAASLFVEDSDTENDYRFQYQWNGESSGEMGSENPIFSVDLEIQNKNNLKVENLSEKNLFVTITKSGIPELDQPVDMQSHLELTVQYFDMNGNLIDATNLPHGKDFYAKVTVSNPGSFGNLENLALSQIFPSGWEIINTRMLDLGASLKSDKSDFVDYRDDRVNTFFPLNSSRKKTFIVLLNAAYQGKFYLPATQCSAMYNNEVSATAGGGWVNIVK